MGDAEPEGKDYFNPLSLYRERPNSCTIISSSRYFNPLSLYRERPRRNNMYTNENVFQSTLPIQGETQALSSFVSISPLFQSTLPIQGETGRDIKRRNRGGISIHSPYTGRDRTKRSTLPKSTNFNPLSLYRERQRCRRGNYIFHYFNPLSLYRERQQFCT